MARRAPARVGSMVASLARLRTRDARKNRHGILAPPESPTPAGGLPHAASRACNPHTAPVQNSAHSRPRHTLTLTAGVARAPRTPAHTSNRAITVRSNRRRCRCRCRRSVAGQSGRRPPPARVWRGRCSTARARRCVRGGICGCLPGLVSSDALEHLLELRICYLLFDPAALRHAEHHLLQRLCLRRGRGGECAGATAVLWRAPAHLLWVDNGDGPDALLGRRLEQLRTRARKLSGERRAGRFEARAWVRALSRISCCSASFAACCCMSC